MTIQHLKNFFLKIEVHPITLIYFLLALIGGYLKWYLSTLAIVCFHELCHLMMAYYFHFEIDKIEILPFGAYLSLDDFFYHPIIHEICVVLAGPCSHLFLYFFIETFINGVYQDYLLMMNMFVFGFNLVPIYPMDGGRLMSLLLQRLMDLKRALELSLKISVFSFCVLSICYLKINTLVIIGYLFVQQITYWKAIPTMLRQYYSHIPSLYERKKIILNQKFIYRRDYHNYYQRQEGMVDEKDMVYELLLSVKK